VTQPLPPLIFCPLGMALIVAGYYAGDLPGLAALVAVHAISIAFALLSGLWSYQALRFVTADSKTYRRAGSASRILLIAGIFGGLGDLAVVCAIRAQPPDNTIYVIPGMFVVAGYLVPAAFSTMALWDAEGKSRKSLLATITFIEFVYAFLFAPLLYARMERLADARR
jgi:hypothetical protein